MNTNKLQALVIEALEDVKAQDILLFDTSEQTALFERLIVATGTSNRQTRALAASVRDKIKTAGGDIVSIEGEKTGEWVLVDLGHVIVHLMQPAIRDYYRLEELWGEKPISLEQAKKDALEPEEPAKKAKKPKKAKAEKTDKAEKADKPKKTKTAAKTAKADKPAKAVKTAKATKTKEPKAVKTTKAKSAKSVKTVKASKAD